MSAALLRRHRPPLRAHRLALRLKRPPLRAHRLALRAHGPALRVLAIAVLVAAIASCTSGNPSSLRAGTATSTSSPGALSTGASASAAGTRSTGTSASAAGTRTATSPGTSAVTTPGSPLPPPMALMPFAGQPVTGQPVTGQAGQGVWRAVARPIRGSRAVYVTALTPPGGTQPAGIAWMDTSLLSARLYSGSVSPGGGPFRFTAPIQPAQAATLVAAFNGGFKMKDARGGYYTEGRVIVPLRQGAASLVIYANGRVDIGAWGTDVTMKHSVVAVRQNLTPLVISGRPAPRAATTAWLHTWGNTCGAHSCSASVPGIENQWRSGAGVTADGALVYVTGPALDPLQLAELLIRAGVVRGMELDINPYWPVFVSYDPPTPAGLAAPGNGSKLLPATVQGPATFFTASWARDFITMSARRN